MFKKMMLLAMAVAAVVAFAIPAVASANWKLEGSELTTNAGIVYHGNAAFTSETGKVICPEVTAEVELVAKTTSASVNSFEVTGPEACDVSGTVLPGLAGGTNSLVESGLEEAAAATVSGGNLSITG